MKSLRICIIILALCSLITACNENSSPKGASSENANNSDVNTPECSDENPCTETGRVCSPEGICIIPFSPEQPNSQDTSECSESKPCQGTDVCANGTCLKTLNQSCYGDNDCPEGFGCDNQKCVDERSCSMTRTCSGNQVCQNGLCIEKKEPACDSTHPCADSTKTCVAGNCVACSCTEEQVCQIDGSCLDAGISQTKNLKVGDPCDWQSFEEFCEGNQKFSCYGDGGEPQVQSWSCGSKVCTTTSEEGTGCYEPCIDENTFFGVCINTFSTDASAEFTRECELTADNLRVWTLKYGFKDCEVGCENGRCIFVPAEFHETCTMASYPDACKGDWITYCYGQDGSTVGEKTGTYCPSMSADHICSLPSDEAKAMQSDILGYCNLPCNEKGKSHSECVQDSEGSIYSVSYLCAPDTQNRLTDFMISQTPCTNGCNDSDGSCQN